MFVYTTQKDYTVRCKSHLTTKNHTGERGGGGQRGSKVISEGMSVCASDCCQIVVAKNSQVIVLSDCRTKWVGFAIQDKFMNKKN